ncbi:MAG TPA: cellulase family glycosylhydrolase [Mycobacteriales bacterium]|nr:cellulase family glycosylhydrolase [Mycobacteriales bacterium]
MTELTVRSRTGLDDGRPTVRRRRWYLAALTGVVAALAAGLVTVPRLVHRGPPTVCGADALQAEAVSGLANFATWLRANEVSGLVGEVGWPAGPDAARWDALADTWYRAADLVGLPVTAWAAARWPASYPMAVYRASAGSTSLNTSGPQAAMVERHLSTRRYLRGVVLAGGSFGTGAGYSAARPGRYGYDYSYENWPSYRFLAERGVKLVRLALAWERLQPVPGGPLSPTEVARLRQALDSARRTGLAVVLDLHSFGEFVAGGPAGPRRLALGSADLPAAALADFWARTVAAIRAEPAVVGYGVLNEPLTLAARGPAGARLWEQASQQAVDAIRRAGGSVTVIVSGYGQTSPTHWGTFHPRAWIHDPAGRVGYEAHAYFDADGSGHYAAGYDAELQRADHAGVGRCVRLPELTAAGLGGPP